MAIASSYMSRASCSLLLPSMVSHQLYVIKSSSQLKGAIQAVIEFVTKRGHELVKIDVSRFSYLKISVVLKNKKKKKKKKEEDIHTSKILKFFDTKEIFK